MIMIMKMKVNVYSI